MRIKHGNALKGLLGSELSLRDELSHGAIALLLILAPLLSPISQESCAALIFTAYAHKTGAASTAPEDADVPGYLREVQGRFGCPFESGLLKMLAQHRRRERSTLLAAGTWHVLCVALSGQLWRDDTLHLGAVLQFVL